MSLGTRLFFALARAAGVFASSSIDRIHEEIAGRLALLVHGVVLQEARLDVRRQLQAGLTVRAHKLTRTGKLLLVPVKDVTLGANARVAA